MAARLAAGPMVGAVEMREATIWLQTDEAAEVWVEYWAVFDPDRILRSAPAQTAHTDAFTAKLVLGEVMPGVRYEYAVWLDGEPVLRPYALSFETPPFFRERNPPPDFTVALGSGHYVEQEGFEPPYVSLGGGYEVFDAILAQQPKFMLWLGDSAVMREPDWGSRSGYMGRYTHNRAHPALQPLLGGMPNAFALGAREYGPGDATRWFWNRGHALEAFEHFTANPTYGLPGLEGAMTRLRWGDADFFLLDVRSHRELEGTPKVLGEAQIDWLISALRRSDARFKIVCAGAPVLNPVEAAPNLREAKREADGLIDRLTDLEIEGLLFLSGGKRFGELTKRVRSGGYDLFDLTVGPLTMAPLESREEANYFREPATSTLERHFATISFSGSEAERALTLRVFAINGQELWSRTIPAAELR